VPILDRPDIHDFENELDLNERRVRDAESLATVFRNAPARVALEIGTSTGLGTVLMAINAPKTNIYTVNILPEDTVQGEGGELITFAPPQDEIGKEYKKRGLKNITQIFANTATWEPDIGTIDIAYIDGCHDSEFVYNDTRKVLQHARSGSFILWHDFNPALAGKYAWMNDVCLGIEKLYKDGLLKERIYHLKDSWVGIYKVNK
jgi:hypothetical protein